MYSQVKHCHSADDPLFFSPYRRKRTSTSSVLSVFHFYKYQISFILCNEINILQATYEAMRQAVSRLSVQPQLLLNDAVTIPEIQIPQVPIIKGDAKSVSIAAASIVAKVTRDRMMEEYDKVLPEYGFASNKGYGSAAHIEALKKYGPSPIHRKTFITHFV